MSLIDNMMITQPDDWTLTDDYKTFIESMVGYLRIVSSSQIVQVNSDVGYLYRFDMTRFLLNQGVPIEDHYLILRVNGFTSVHEIDETLQTLIVPDMASIARLKSVYRTRLSA